MFSVFTADDIPTLFFEAFLGSQSLSNTSHTDFSLNKNSDTQNQLLTSKSNTSSILSYIFFEENSTRTRESFKIALQSLKIPVINIEIASSSLKKGEGLMHTVETLANYSDKAIVIVRSNTRLSIQPTSNISFINAGDGINEHPTQAVGDLLTIFKTLNTKYHKNFLKNINILICGDIENSRVARSNIKLLTRFGAKITLVAPPHLLTQNTATYYHSQYECNISRNITQKLIEEANFAIFLRTQTERSGQFVDVDLSSFALTDKNLHWIEKNTFIMHPGPVNIGKELSPSAFYHPNSLIQKQVSNALEGRKALIQWILSS